MINNSRGYEKLKFDEVRDVVLSESIRKREIGNSHGIVLSVDQRGRSKSKSPNNGRSKSKNQGKSPNKSNVKGWSCGVRTDCTRPKRNQNHKSEDDDDSIHSAEDIGDTLVLSVDNLIESSILDLGASFHSSPNKELFQNFRSENFEKAYLANKAWILKENGMSA